MCVDDMYVEMLNYSIKRMKLKLHCKDKYPPFLSFSGWKGIGKTSAVLAYCKKYNNCLYFSFANTEPSLALKLFVSKYPKILNDCTDWKTFFVQLRKWCSKRSCVIFFDSYAYKAESDFYNELWSTFLNQDNNTIIVFIEDKFGECRFTPLHLAEIKKIYPKTDNEDIAMLKAVTGGIGSLVCMYNPKITFEQNLKRFLQRDSFFYRLGEIIINTYYRTPESYNTLLYGIAIGKRRVSELSEFSGYPNNKCDKYLKSLIKNGFVKHVEVKTKKGTKHSHYEITNEYLSFWYRYIFPLRNHNDDITFENILKYIKAVLVKSAFRKECKLWLYTNARAYRFTNSDFYKYDASIYENVKLNNVKFNMIHENYGDYIFIKFFDTIGEHCTKEDWDKIEKATLDFSRRENNTYILFSIHRFSEYCWKQSSKYDNIRLVQITSFTPQYDYIEYYRYDVNEY